MMTLYEFAPTRSIRARWTLQELGVPFEAVTVDLLAGENRAKPYVDINPAGKVPALVDGDVVLTESVAIVLYLAEKYPEKGLVPADPEDRAQLYKWLLFAATELEQPLWRISKHTALYPEAKRLPAELPLARADFAPMAQVAEDHMNGREFVVGDRASVADFVLAYTLDWAKEVGLLEDCPRLGDYLERMYRRPQAPMRIAAALASIRG